MVPNLLQEIEHQWSLQLPLAAHVELVTCNVADGRVIHGDHIIRWPDHNDGYKSCCCFTPAVLLEFGVLNAHERFTSMACLWVRTGPKYGTRNRYGEYFVPIRNTLVFRYVPGFTGPASLLHWLLLLCCWSIFPELYWMFRVLSYPVCKYCIFSCAVGAWNLSVAACRGKLRSRNVTPSCTAFWCCFSEKCQQTCLCEGMTKI